jgi:uncharacterized protein
MKEITKIKFQASGSSGEVSGLLLLPSDSKALLTFAHGAGAPMDHPFMNKIAEYLGEEKIGTLRYNFPYTEKKIKSISPAPILMETVRSSVKTAEQYAGDLPLFAGGKSMGGRMTSQASAVSPLEGVRGLIFFGFPLHAPGKKSDERAEHLYKVNLPMLFLQGTRDKLADLELLRPVISKMGDKADLYIIEGADHSFHVLKSSGRSDDAVLKETAKKVGDWIKSLLNKKVK